MAVYKTQRKEGELLAITKARDAAEYTLKITHNEKVFPKKARYTVVKKLQDKAVEMVMLTVEANEIYPRNRLEYEARHAKQIEAMAAARAIMSVADMCIELYGISPSRVEYWTKQLTIAQNTISGWCKKDAERFKEYAEN